jgi:hypothetical protein
VFGFAWRLFGWLSALVSQLQPLGAWRSCAVRRILASQREVLATIGELTASDAIRSVREVVTTKKHPVT